MFHLDVLSGYFICGISALLGAAILRLAEAIDADTQAAMHDCGLGFVVLGLGLLPAGLGSGAVHAAAQWTIGVATVLGLLVLARGLGRLHGRLLPQAVVAGGTLATAAGLGMALWLDRRLFGDLFAVCLVVAAAVMGWQTRGFIARPRDLLERAMGLAILALVVSSLVRAIVSLAVGGPPRIDMMYLPAPWSSVYAALYSMLPMCVATLMLTMVNTRLRHQLVQRASIDELTGVLTRRALREAAPALLETQRASSGETALLMLDLDHFKAVNDHAGHATGDAALRLAAALLQAELRRGTLLARYGGEEFVALAPVADLASARLVAERLRQAIGDADWCARLPLRAGLTVSVGVVLVAPSECLDAALRRADAALYRAKHGGRNQCQVGLAAA